MRSPWLFATVCAVGVTGCFGDKAINMTLEPPPAAVAMGFDTGCVTAVELFVDGPNYVNDGNDFTRDCHEIAPGNTTFEAVRAAISGKFDLALPPNGIGNVELYAYSGTCDNDPTLFDLSFYSGAKYTGDDMVLPMTPNVSCTPATVNVRPVDILKLVATKQCAMSGWPTGELALGTMNPIPFFNSLDWWGRQSKTPITNGIATIHALTKIGPHSCLSVGLFTDSWKDNTCVTPADQVTCATGTEMEAAIINPTVGLASQNALKLNKWGAMTVGAVIGTPIAPIGGATVEVDAADKDKCEIVMLDMAPGVENGTGSLTERAGNTTGPSGLFAIYAQSFIRITVTAPGKTPVKRTVATFVPDLASAFTVRF